MRIVKRLTVAFSMVLAVLAVATAWAQQQQRQAANTVITVPSMDCDVCAKSVGGEVAKVRGIEKIEYDVKGRTLTVIPLPKSVLSARSLWEACEKADHPPTKLQGPSGTFTKKPPS